MAVESSGVFGPVTLQFLQELGQRLRQVSSDANAYSYLIQRLSVAVQQGNRASVLGSTRSTTGSTTLTLIIIIEHLFSTALLKHYYIIFITIIGLTVQRLALL